jgi:hypothetical protein
MVSLTFYGGVNEIGGNKILLEDSDRRLFLDFGFPYKRYKQFYEEYLKPRSDAGLLDPLTIGLLPPLEGSTATIWRRLASGASAGTAHSTAGLTKLMAYCYPTPTSTTRGTSLFSETTSRYTQLR